MTWGLRAASVDVNGEPALRDIDVSVDEGSVVAVVGGDGAGKTTVARTLVGLLRPHTGGVGRPGPTRIGYLPSSSGVWPDLTVVENLGFVADAHRIRNTARRSRIDDLLEVTGLEAAADRLGADLSGGMRQKLGVAMALFHRPDLLVLDEPTTGVDPVSRSDLWQLMTTAVAGGAALLFTTTYLDEAERAQSITVLESGRVLASGSVAEIEAAVEGSIVDRRGAARESWRRGREWRSWKADGSVPDGASRVDPDLTDLLVAASISKETRS